MSEVNGRVALRQPQINMRERDAIGCHETQFPLEQFANAKSLDFDELKHWTSRLNKASSATLTAVSMPGGTVDIAIKAGTVTASPTRSKVRGKQYDYSKRDACLSMLGYIVTANGLGRQVCVSLSITTDDGCSYIPFDGAAA